MDVIKCDGKTEPFQIEKVINTIHRAGFPLPAAKKIATQVAGQVYDGIPSREVLKLVRQILRQINPSRAPRYDLKKALFDLGPSGYPFEDYLSLLFERLGYKVSVRRIFKGRCTNHELDVVIEKGRFMAFIEAKFRHTKNGKVDTKDALYTYARLIDLKPAGFTKGYLITNGRFTTETIDYGRCSGLSLISWDYPPGAGLSALIEKHALYPLTLLPRLGKRFQETLTKRGIVLLEQAVEKNLNFLKDEGLSDRELRSLQKKARDIYQGNED